VSDIHLFVAFRIILILTGKLNPRKCWTFATLRYSLRDRKIDKRYPSV